MFELPATMPFTVMEFPLSDKETAVGFELLETKYVPLPPEMVTTVFWLGVRVMLFWLNESVCALELCTVILRFAQFETVPT